MVSPRLWTVFHQRTGLAKVPSVQVQAAFALPHLAVQLVEAVAVVNEGLQLDDAVPVSQVRCVAICKGVLQLVDAVLGSQVRCIRNICASTRSICNVDGSFNLVVGVLTPVLFYR